MEWEEIKTQADADSVMEVFDDLNDSFDGALDDDRL